MKLLLLLLVHQTSAVIHHLNFTEYSKMPELYQMDDYDVCMAELGGIYCVIDADLSSKEDSELMQMILEYSEDKVKHYNHTKVHRAICVTTTCKDFTQNRSLEREADLRSVLEECVDDAIWKGYKLNAKLTDIQYCKKRGEKRTFDTGDYILTGVYIILIIFNAVGTSYDVINCDAGENPYLLAFSLRKNFAKLIAHAGEGADPRLKRLKVFNGLRTLTMSCIFLAHVALLFSLAYLKNPYYMESSYDDPGTYILLNGLMVTYTFFVMSGFLLAFNLEMYAEKHRVSLWDWPKGMLMRWLRLTPTYALIMFTVMTLMRHLGDGPQWESLVTSEADACYQYWWAHLIYINNYISDDSHCFPQSWYLAADMQLFGLGLLVCILFRKPRAQVLALAFMLAVALVIPAAHVYFQDWGAVAIQTPEGLRTLYKNDTNRIMYMRGHTNMSTYTLGIAGGLLVYHWLNNEKSISERLQKYSWLVWLTVPTMVGTLLSAGIFYMDNYEPSTLMKALYASVHKPIFQLNIVFIIIACIFKAETLIRGILEWRGFTWTGRVSYAGFLLHSLFLRGLFGSLRLPSYMSNYNVMTYEASTIVLSFGAGALLFVTVESPMTVLTKTMLAPRRKELITEDATAKDVATKV